MNASHDDRGRDLVAKIEKAPAAGRELTDAELDDVVGGGRGYYGYSRGYYGRGYGGYGRGYGRGYYGRRR